MLWRAITKVIDQTYLNIRMLTAVLAVHALRPTDKVKYRALMTMILESEPNLRWQGLVTKILVGGQRCIWCAAEDRTKITSKAVVLATGTFLRGEVVMGLGAREGAKVNQVPRNCPRA